MKERPILFQGDMVRAILAAIKTQTRRLVKPQAGVHCKPWERDGLWKWLIAETGHAAGDWFRCPYGVPGDRLWVREAFMHEPADYCWEASVSIPCRPASTTYRADVQGDSTGAGWTPSIHMPRKLSRITLEVTGVRVERLQAISEADAIDEGAPCVDEATGREVLFPHASKAGNYRLGYRALWERINGAGSWEANPWVWVVEFKRC